MSTPVANRPLPADRHGDASKRHAGRVSAYLCYALLTLVIVLFAAIRYRLREMPLERDEGEYAYAGQLILHGVPPYQLAYNMKLPGTYLAYAVIVGVFGQKPSGVHVGLLVMNAITTLLMFLLARRFFGRLPSVVASVTYALLSTSPAVLGLEGHATHFVIFFAISGLLLLLNGMGKEKPWLLFGAGCLLGVAFIMKQPGIFFPIFGAVYLFAHERKRPAGLRTLLSRTGVYSLGAVLPFAITCLVLYCAGVFNRFWFWTFSYARTYAASVDFPQGLGYLISTAALVVGAAPLVWTIALLGIIACLWNSTTEQSGRWCLAFLLFSFLAVCPGLYFRPHYFILLLPAVSLLVAAAVSSATWVLGKLSSGKLFAVLPGALFVFAFAASLLPQKELLFVMDPVSACRYIYPRDPFVELLDVAKYIQIYTAKGERFAVLGSEPQTYFYAKRRSVTGYVYTYPLTEDQPYAAAMQRELISDIETTRPKFIVWVDDWDVSPGPTPLILTWAGKYLVANYEVVKVMRLPNSAASDSPIVHVFRRKRVPLHF
ncbi:MAG: glycosyl transferase, family 39 [Acidobacteriaceae bacterium]|nr:glycosyl transferase, family 39 [Acidobacteriaceae bacterium]